MTPKKLTKSERAILQLLSDSVGKKASHKDARDAAKLTREGYFRVRRRMMDRSLIAWADAAASIQATFGGLRAIGGVK